MRKAKAKAKTITRRRSRSARTMSDREFRALARRGFEPLPAEPTEEEWLTIGRVQDHRLRLALVLLQKTKPEFVAQMRQIPFADREPLFRYILAGKEWHKETAEMLHAVLERIMTVEAVLGRECAADSSAASE